MKKINLILMTLLVISSIVSSCTKKSKTASFKIGESLPRNAYLISIVLPKAELIKKNKIGACVTYYEKTDFSYDYIRNGYTTNKTWEYSNTTYYDTLGLPILPNRKLSQDTSKYEEYWDGNKHIIITNDSNRITYYEEIYEVIDDVGRIISDSTWYNDEELKSQEAENKIKQQEFKSTGDYNYIYTPYRTIVHKYDYKTNVVTEIKDGMVTEKITYVKDSENRIIRAIVTELGSGGEDSYDFTYNDQNQIVSSIHMYLYKGEPYRIHIRYTYNSIGLIETESGILNYKYEYKERL